MAEHAKRSDKPVPWAIAYANAYEHQRSSSPDFVKTQPNQFVWPTLALSRGDMPSQYQLQHNGYDGAESAHY